MNYNVIYARLVDRAKGRVLDCYKERHHVVPRCLGGNNTRSNIVELTAEEHYVAHQLLVKMYPEQRALTHAANMMSVRCTGNKSFGWLRRRNAIACKERESNKTEPPERNAKCSMTQVGRKKSPEWCAKIAAGLRGKKKSAEHIRNNAESRRGYKHSIAAREKMKLGHAMRSARMTLVDQN